MNRWIPLLLTIVVLAGVAGLAAAAPIQTVTAQDDTGTIGESTESDETNESSISPGERFSGSIGVQNAEVTGEIESRAFEVALDRAETDEERADIVAERLDRSDERLAAIEHRQQELQERRDAGELSQGAYAARMAETAARTESVRRDANRSAVVAHEIPETIRAERGLDAERLETIRERANELGGPEVAAIARGVAGTDVGGPMASDRRGPPGGGPTNESDRPGNDGPPGNAATGTDDMRDNGTNASSDSQSDRTPETTGSNANDGTNGTDSASTTDGGNANETDDASGSPNETKDASGSSNDAEHSTDNTDNTSDTDRRGHERLITVAGGFVSDGATADRSAITDPISSVGDRVQRGVFDLRNQIVSSVP